MLLVLCLVLFSSLPGSDSRRCCPLGEKLIRENETLSCQPFETLHYTQIFLKEQNHVDGVAQCDDINQADYCLEFDNNTVVQVDCIGNSSEIEQSWRHIRLCCPYGYVYSTTQHYCMNLNSTDLTNQFLWPLTTDDDILLVEFGPLSNCDVEYAIVNTPIQPDKIVFDNFTRAFRILDHPELTRGEHCLALHDGPESRHIIRTCMPRSEACTSGRTCVRRCCKDGESYYGSVAKCRPHWQSFPITIYEKYALYLKPYNPNPFGTAISHGISCKKYILNQDDPNEKWSMLNDGTLQMGRNFKQIPYNLFCIDNMQLDRLAIKGMAGMLCGVDSNPLIDIIWAIGMGISAFFLLLTLIVYILIPRLHNLHGKTLVCYALWLMSSYTILAIFYVDTVKGVPCVFLGFFAYFSFMSASSWMNVMCFDIWWTLGGSHHSAHSHTPGNKRRRENHRFAIYATYALVVSTLLTSISVFAQFSPDLIPPKYGPGIGIHSCFLSVKYYSVIIYLISPLAVMYSANIIFFILTVKNFLKIRNEIDRLRDTTKEGKKRKLANDMSKLATNAKLFVVMGIIWIFELISTKVENTSWIWYLSDAANSLHGVLIFCIYVLKRNVLRDLKTRFRQTPLTKNRQDTTISKKSLSTSTSRIERM